MNNQSSTSETSFLSWSHLLSMIGGFCLGMPPRFSLWGKSSFTSHHENGFQNIPDCPGNKMMCPNISLGTVLQTLLKYSVEIQPVLVDSETSYSKIIILKLLILNASDLGATIQVSLKCTWLMCNYLVKLLNSSMLRMMIYLYFQKLQNIDILFGRRGSGW